MSRFRVFTDEQWARVQPMLSSSDGQRGRPFRDHRQVVEGIVYRYRCGIAWRDLSAAFGPWQTVWKRHRRLSADGTWDRIHAALLAEADAAGEIDWTVSVDSTINRAHQHGTNLYRNTGGSVELQEPLDRALRSRRRAFPGRAEHEDPPRLRRERQASGVHHRAGPGLGLTDVPARH